MNATTSQTVDSPEPVTTILTTQHTTARHGFSLSNPKNYLGAPIAVAVPGATGGLIPQHLVRLAGEVKRGATALGLITPHGDLTERGRAIVSHAEATHGSARDALNEFGELKGAGTRFIDGKPEWKAVSQAVLATHPTVNSIMRVAGDAGPTTLPGLVIHAAHTKPWVVEDVLIDAGNLPVATPVEKLQEAAVDDQSTHPEWLRDTHTYQTTTTSHLKSMCYHVGLLTTPGNTTDRLAPYRDEWVVEQPSDSIEASLGGDGRC